MFRCPSQKLVQPWPTGRTRPRTALCVAQCTFSHFLEHYENHAQTVPGHQLSLRERSVCVALGSLRASHPCSSSHMLDRTLPGAKCREGSSHVS